MSIPNKDASADRQSRPIATDDSSQRTEDSSSNSHAPSSHRSISQHKHYVSGGVNMHPPPAPSSRENLSQYASRGEPSQSTVSSPLPGIHSFSTKASDTGSRAEQPADPSFNRQSDSSRPLYPQRVQQSFDDATSYGRDERSAASESRQSSMPRVAPALTVSEGPPLHQLRTGPSAPPPMLTGLPRHSNEDRRYKLVIRQQPQQGRLCGLGSKDKRPLDPLPILQLRILKEDGTEDEDAENSSNLILQASLRKEDPATGTHSESVLVESNDPLYPRTRMLEGRLVASANVARDLDGSRACFFVFTDLSIRQEGQFRLHFKLIALSALPLPTVGGSSSAGGQVLAEALTEPFTIYSPRRFPGMTESTELAKCLARQGIQVPVRNDIRRRQEQPDSHTASNDDKDHLD